MTDHPYWKTLDQTTYTLKIIKMVAHSKVTLLKACKSIILSTIVKKRRARRAAKRRAIWVREWINKNSKLGAFHALQKSLKTKTQSQSGFFCE